MIGITIEGLDLKALKDNAVPAATTDSLIAAGQLWVKEQLPKRFVAGADRKFGLPPRTKGYMLRKAKTKGHQNTLVWSGTLKKTALSSATVKGNRRIVKATVKIPTPAQVDKSETGASGKDVYKIRRRRGGGLTIRRQIQKLIVEDLNFVTKFVGPDIGRRLTTDPKYKLKRQSKKKLA